MEQKNAKYFLNFFVSLNFPLKTKEPEHGDSAIYTIYDSSAGFPTFLQVLL